VTETETQPLYPTIRVLVKLSSTDEGVSLSVRNGNPLIRLPWLEASTCDNLGPCNLAQGEWLS